MAFISFENIKEKHQTFDQTCNYALYALKYVWKRKQGKSLGRDKTFLPDSGFF